jgi:hypothetical protein
LFAWRHVRVLVASTFARPTPLLVTAQLAVFYMVASSAKQRARSVAVHRRFARDHPAADVPLVVYNPAAVAKYLVDHVVHDHPELAAAFLAQKLPFALAPPDVHAAGTDG